MPVFLYPIIRSQREIDEINDTFLLGQLKKEFERGIFDGRISIQKGGLCPI